MSDRAVLGDADSSVSFYHSQRGRGRSREDFIAKSQNNCGFIIVTLRPEDGEITLGAQNTR